MSIKANVLGQPLRLWNLDIGFWFLEALLAAAAFSDLTASSLLRFLPLSHLEFSVSVDLMASNMSSSCVNFCLGIFFFISVVAFGRFSLCLMDVGLMAGGAAIVDVRRLGFGDDGGGFPAICLTGGNEWVAGFNGICCGWAVATAGIKAEAAVP